MCLDIGHVNRVVTLKKVSYKTMYGNLTTKKLATITPQGDSNDQVTITPGRLGSCLSLFIHATSYLS